MHATRLAVVALVLVATLGTPGVGVDVAAADGCAFPTTHADATGTQVTVPEAPAEVVTLNPSAAQTMYEIDAWDRVVGVSAYASYLPGADGKTTVGTGRGDATIENTVALDPDLVLAPNTISGGTVSDLRAAGLTVYRFEAADDVAAVVEKTRLTGELVGACEGADATADEMERRIDVVESAVADEERPAAFFSFAPGGWTVGEGTFVHQAIATAGGENVAAENPGVNDGGGATTGYFPVNAEVVVEEDPAWFVLDGGGYDAASVPAGPGGIYEGTTAYREGNAVLVDPNHISQPAPRIVDAIVHLVRAFHPQAYENEIEGRIDSDSLGGERTTTAERGADGSVALRAANLGRTRTVGFDLPSRPNATAEVRRVDVALATVNPTFTVRLRDGDGPAPPNGTRALETVGLAANGLYPDDLDHLTLRLAVNRSRLDGADPETIRLYRHDGSGWTPLQTTRVNASAGGADADASNATTATPPLVYEARTTGLSTVVLAVDDPAAPTAAATNATATPPAATATPTPTPPTAAPATPTPESPTETTSGGGPGFGLPVAAAALVALALAGRWRR